MSTRTKSAWRRGAVVGVAAAALAMTAVPSADAARLPNGKARGDGFTIIRTGESYRVDHSMAANGAGRSVLVSGKATVLAPGIDTRESGPENDPLGEEEMPGSNGTSSTGAAATLSIGYVVGCQVDIGSLDLGLSAAITDIRSLGFGGAGGTISLPLAPGQIVYAQIDKKKLEKPGTYHFDWLRSQMEIQGCGGYAQARSHITVEKTGEDHEKVSLWGKPFTMG
ncbi:MspA family porin [Gordonia sp. (in: high G+C Gram-positive bacteria)]|uniref:MspA family porin n=1 Tax=Gordonia sp. (in: high G+C Gram-positive bacteria) TaxID=84139 RepID=UPI0039E5B0B8